MDIQKLILNYKPYSEQEVIDKEYYLNFISNFDKHSWLSRTF